MRTRAERRHLGKKKFNKTLNYMKNASGWWWNRQPQAVVDFIKKDKLGKYRCRCSYCEHGKTRWRKIQDKYLEEGIEDYYNHYTWADIIEEEMTWAEYDLYDNRISYEECQNFKNIASNTFVNKCTDKIRSFTC